MEKEIFDQAERFYKTCKVIWHQFNLDMENKQDVSLLVPGYVNAAFTIELYFKCLFYIQNKYLPPNMHYLDKLFSKLTLESQGKIEEYFNSFINANQQFFTLKLQFGIEAPELKVMLRQNSNSFQECRYIFQFSPEYSLHSKDIIDATRRYISEIRPDFTPLLRIYQ